MRYLTSRLFVHNLFICCKISDKDFHTDLNQITYDIISDKINCAIKMLNEAGCIEDTTSLLAKSFFTKLEEMKLYLATGNKSKDYYLLTIYNEAWNTYKRIESMTSKECKFPISDLNLLLEFKECLYKLFYEYGVESASYKTLQEILKASVTNYKKHQVPFVNFLLANIFPRIKSQYTPGFFATLESYPLEKLIFTDCSLTCNDASLPHNVAGLNVIRDLFDELFEISISDHELIGNKLVEIYKNLLNYRLEDNDDMEANKDIADTKRVSNLDDSDMMEYNDDSTLSIHIISFMRWIPVMVEDEDGIERMEFVDHVLSHIGDEVRKKLKERYTVQDFIKCETSLFIWEQNTDLRTLLMHAMSREPYFYKCFREYYKDSFQCNVGGLSMSNIVIFGATQSGKTTLLGYLSTAMLRNPQFNEEVYQKLKLIKTLTVNDEFNIGNPNNPKKVNKDVILPSFVSLDRDELRKFKDQNTEGTTKRLHRKQLTICMSENFTENGQEETENISCAFVDTPGFRQRLSDQYRGFFEGDVGVAVLKLQEVIELSEMLERKDSVPEKIFALEKRLFEPIRIWCDYRSAAHLVIVLSQVDRVLHSGQTDEFSIHALQKGVECVHLYTDGARGGRQIPISPISIKLKMTENKKKIRRMAQFFTRDAENIYTPPAWASYNNVGDGTFISCLKRVLPKTEMSGSRAFSLASADRIIRTMVGHTTKPVISILPLYGSIRCTDTVILGPILDKDTNEPVYANCKISSIKADGAKEISDLLLEGNVGGVIFKRIQNVETLKQYHIDSVSKNSEIKLLKSTILFSGDVLRGDLLELEIRKDEYLTIFGNLDEIYSKILPSIMPFDQVFLFWHGKKISVNIVEISFLESMCKLTLLISNSERNTVNHFAIPCDADRKIKYRENVLLAVSESKYSDKKGSRQNTTEVYTYISATVSGLKESTTFGLVKIEGSQYIYLDAIFNGSIHIEGKTTTDGIDSLLIPIKNRKGSISIDSILTTINQSLKKEINLSEYRRNGGIKLTLL